MRKVVELHVRYPLKDGIADFGPFAAAIGTSKAKVSAMTAAASSAGRMMNIRLMVENPASALKAFSSAKIGASKHTALLFKMSNRANALTRVTAALGQVDSKILAMTAAASSAGRMMNIKLEVSDPATAMTALKAPTIE